MTDLKVGDLVRIVAQSKSINSHIRMEGLSGYIEEIVGDNAQFKELREDGLGGCGGVPLTCLVKDDSERLRQLKEKHDAYIEKFCKEAEARTARYNSMRDKYLKEACNRTGVSMQSVMTIFEIAEEFQGDWGDHGWISRY
jgi:hypothetical protein